MRYAMVLENRVIDVIESKYKPKYPPGIDGNEVISVECGSEVKVGMVYDDFLKIFSEFKLPAQPPTMEEKIYAAVSKTQDEIRQEGADSVMEEMKKRGLIV